MIEPADVQDLVGVQAADVWKAGRLAAHLSRTPDGVAFSYVPDYDGPPVATTLPVRPAPVVRANGALPAFFTGLLPEGPRLSALRRAVKTSVDDELSLLLAVGSDTNGDVQVVPEGAEPYTVGYEATFRALAAVCDARSLALRTPARAARLRRAERQRRCARQELLGAAAVRRRVSGLPRLRGADLAALRRHHPRDARR